jgi:hypothetical protein
MNHSMGERGKGGVTLGGREGEVGDGHLLRTQLLEAKVFSTQVAVVLVMVGRRKLTLALVTTTHTHTHHSSVPAK